MQALLTFPKVYWSPWDSDVEFLPGSELPAESSGNIYAVIVHAFFGEQVVMADITGRGVCVPSGRVDTGESVDGAALRETFEETGGHLDAMRRQLIGCYRMMKRGTTKAFFSACFVADITHFSEIPAGSESNGYYLLAPENVADQYFMWDDLLAAVFEFAYSERARLFPPGEKIGEG